MLLLKVLLPDDALELDDAALGAYIKLKALASQMTIKGVMVNGTVLCLEDIAKRAALGDNWQDTVQQLVAAGYLSVVSGVWFLANSQVLYHNTNYGDDAIARVVGVVRQSVSSKELPAVVEMIHDAGSFKKERTTEEVRAEIMKLYEQFGDKRGIVISYIGLFRTKTQIATDTKMDVAKHLKLVKQMVQMFEAKKMSFRGKEHPFSDEMFRKAVSIVVERKVQELRNHNYFKVVLMNQVKPEKGKGNGRRGTVEGY